MNRITVGLAGIRADRRGTRRHDSNAIADDRIAAHRTRRTTFIGAGALLAAGLAILFQAPPAEAKWSYDFTSNNSYCDGSGFCSTAWLACASAVGPGEVYVWLDRVTWNRNSEGEITSANCYGQHFLAAGGISNFVNVTPWCDPGYVKGGIGGSGCVKPIANKTLGLQCGAESPGGNQSTGGTNPITLSSGNKFEKVVDFASAGSEPLQFVRYYNSMDYRLYALGYGWRHNYSGYLRFPSASTTEIVYHHGARLTYTLSGSDWVPSDPDITFRLAKSGTDWLLTTNRDTVETYDSAGRLTLITYRGGYQQKMAYSGANLIAVTDTHGQFLGFDYGTNGLLRKMTDSNGEDYLYGYGKMLNLPSQATDRLVAVAYPDDTPADDTDNPTVTYVYEDTNNPMALTGIIDENGNRLKSWAYDSDGRAIMSEHAGGADHADVVYNANGTVSVTNALGKQATYHFATVANGPELTQIEGIASANCVAANKNYTYDSNGLVASATDWNNNQTTYVRDSRGRETSRTEAAGTPEARTITTTWHADFRLPTQIVEPGRTVDLSYDAAGLLLQRTETDTTTQSVPYSTNGETRTSTYTYTLIDPPASVPLPDPVPLPVVNGNAETGSISGWTTQLGALLVRTGDPSPHGGAYYFYGGPNAESIAYQDIAIPPSQYAAIDNGGLYYAVAEYWQTSYVGSDQGQMQLEARDASGQVLEIGGNGPSAVSTKSWQKRAVGLFLAPGTRTIRIKLRGIRKAGTNLDAYFDDTSLELRYLDGFRPLFLTNADVQASSMAGWTQTLGGFWIKNFSPVPLLGSYYFYGGAHSESKMHQDAAIPAEHYNAVDAGDRKAHVTWLQAAYFSSDKGQASMIALDSAGAYLGSVSSPLAAVGTNKRWQSRVLEWDLPPGTRTIRLELHAKRYSGTNNDAYFDDINLALLWTVPTPPAGQMARLATVDGPRTGVADITTFAYDSEGYLSTVTNALGHITTITDHDPGGLPLSVTDANNVVTDLAYDPLGRLLSRSVRDAGGDAVTAFTYDDAGQIAAVTLPNGTALHYEYDTAQRLTAVSNDLGERIDYTLNAAGNRTAEIVKSSTGAIVRTQTRTFDELGRLLQNIGAAAQTTTYAYDPDGNTTAVTDALSQTTAQAFDGLNRLVGTTDPLLGQAGRL